MIGRLSVEKTLAASTEGDANAALHLLLACFCLSVATCLCHCDADLNAGKRILACWFNAATIANLILVGKSGICEALGSARL